VLAGILLGLGFAVKPTMLLVAVGLVIGVRRQRRVVAGLAAAFGVVVMANVLLIGPGSGRWCGRAAWCQRGPRGVRMRPSAGGAARNAPVTDSNYVSHV
jgi:hypothetical protein